MFITPVPAEKLDGILKHSVEEASAARQIPHETLSKLPVSERKRLMSVTNFIAFYVTQAIDEALSAELGEIMDAAYELKNSALLKGIDTVHLEQAIAKLSQLKVGKLVPGGRIPLTLLAEYVYEQAKVVCKKAPRGEFWIESFSADFQEIKVSNGHVEAVQRLEDLIFFEREPEKAKESQTDQSEEDGGAGEIPVSQN